MNNISLKNIQQIIQRICRKRRNSDEWYCYISWHLRFKPLSRWRIDQFYSSVPVCTFVWLIVPLSFSHWTFVHVSYILGIINTIILFTKKIKKKSMFTIIYNFIHNINTRYFFYLSLANKKLYTPYNLLHTSLRTAILRQI